MERKSKLVHEYFKDNFFYTEELTLDLFKKLLESTNEEFTFFYEQFVIYVSKSEEKVKDKYLMSIEEGNKIIDFAFDEIDFLINAKIIKGKSLKEIWSLLYN